MPILSFLDNATALFLGRSLRGPTFAPTCIDRSFTHFELLCAVQVGPLLGLRPHPTDFYRVRELMDWYELEMGWHPKYHYMLSS